MGNNSILIDTSAWIEFFRGHSRTAETVTSLIESGRASLCGVIYYELLQGAKDDEEALRLPNALSALKHFEMTLDTWIQAGHFGSRLRRKGITLPMSDILVGVVALEHGLQVLSLDRHFKSIPGLMLYKE